MVDRETLVRLLAYDELSGVFTWLRRDGDTIGNRRWNPHYAGRRAGRLHLGYVMIRIAHREYMAHRLAWIYMTGEQPPKEIDHKDGEPSNNAWSNLRSATRSQQLANTRRTVRNTSGFKGARWSKPKCQYQAYITIDGKFIHLGYFDTAEAAHQAWLNKSTSHFGEYARAA